jgi:hypothetical protein
MTQIRVTVASAEEAYNGLALGLSEAARQLAAY